MEFAGDGVTTQGIFRIIRSGSGKFLILFPEGGATLVSSDSPLGPWQPVTSLQANGQYEVTPEGVSKFYRLRWP
jgi:hypothetical protein